MFRLSQIGIFGKFYFAISSMYSNPKSKIILREFETEFFDCPVGLKQGSSESPILFAIYVNSLAEEIKATNIGIRISWEGDNLNNSDNLDNSGNEMSELINILLYCDDIVILTENEEDLQYLLIIVENWCRKWQLEVNLSKTNILHVRRKNKNQSRFVFLFNKRPLEYCHSYKYLGTTLNCHLDYAFTLNILAESASRALGSIVCKMIKNGGFPYKVFTLLVDCCVNSILDYAGEVFGFKDYNIADNIYLRAARVFMGLPRNAPKQGIISEINWLLPNYRTKIKMIKYYNKIIKLDDSRLLKKVLL